MIADIIILIYKHELKASKDNTLILYFCIIHTDRNHAINENILKYINSLGNFFFYFVKQEIK